jgi:hypothetical protein
MIMMEFIIVMVKNIVLLKILTTFDSLIFMGIKIKGKKGLHYGLGLFHPSCPKDFHSKAS